MLHPQALRPRLSLHDSSAASTSGREDGSVATRGYSSLEDSWDLDDGGYTPFPSNLPTAPPHGEAWRGGGAGAAPGGFDKQSYELWQYTKSLHFSTADSGDLWRTLANVRPADVCSHLCFASSSSLNPAGHANICQCTATGSLCERSCTICVAGTVLAEERIGCGNASDWLMSCL